MKGLSGKLKAILTCVSVVFGISFAFCLVFWMMISLAFMGGDSEDIVSRVTSPTGGIDAVLTETNGGATTSFGYLVYLVPHGKEYKGEKAAAFLYGAERSESAYGVNLRWRDEQTLVMEFWRAKSATSAPQVDVGGKTVRLILKKQVNDPKAPSGGMLYNLQSRPEDG